LFLSGDPLMGNAERLELFQAGEFVEIA